MSIHVNKYQDLVNLIYPLPIKGAGANQLPPLPLPEDTVEESDTVVFSERVSQVR